MVDMQWIALDLAFTVHYARNSKSFKEREREKLRSPIAAKRGKETVRRLMNAG